MRFYILILLSLFTVSCGDRNASVGSIPKGPIQVEATVPSDVTGLSEELKNVRARERILVGALEDAKTESRQTKLWVGAGTCAFAGLVLIGLGIWTTRTVLIQIGAGAFGLGGLCVVLAWLVPFALYIGLGVGVLVVGVAVYMLVNREKTLTKTTNAIEELKTYVPKWKEILVKHVGLGTSADKIISSIRDGQK